MSDTELNITTLNQLPVIIQGSGTYNLRNGGQAVIHRIEPYQGEHNRLEVTAFEAKGALIKLFRGKLQPRGYAIWHVSGRALPFKETPLDIVSRVPDTPEQYAKKKGGYCPACGSSDGLDGSMVEIDGNEAFQPMHCHDCSASWVDRYTLAGFSGLETE